MSALRGLATQAIPFGSLVLCRGFRVSLASPDVANGVAKARPLYAGEKPIYAPGDHVIAEPIAGLGARNLQALADAPLMDANNLYLPAGRISLAEAKAREAATIECARPEPRP